MLDTTAERAETLLETVRVYGFSRQAASLSGSVAMPHCGYRRWLRRSWIRNRRCGACLATLQLLGEDVWTPRQREIECCQQILAVTETRGEVLYRSYALRAMAVAIWAAGKSQSRGRATRAVFTTDPEEERIVYYRSVSRGFCLGPRKLDRT